MINATGNRMTFEIARQSRLARAIEQTQIQISTGNRIQQPSDDPGASARIADIRRTQADSDVWKRNIELGGSLAGQADGILQTLNERLARAQELTIQGSAGSQPQGARDTIAAEIRAIADEIGALSQIQSSLGEPLFSTSAPRAMRFAEGVVFAPVPSQTSVFTYAGLPLVQHLETLAVAVQGGARAQLNAALITADALVQHGAGVAATIGNSAARLDRLASANEARSIDLAVERTGLEKTDLTTAIATLHAQQLTLEAAQSAFARINRRSLIELLS